MLSSIREFIRGPVGALIAVVSTVLTVIAAINFFHHHPRLAWMWLFFGALALVVLAFWRYHQMRQARNQLTQSMTATMVEMGPGASLSGASQISRNVIMQGGGPQSAAQRRKRSRRRRFTRDHQADLADEGHRLADRLEEFGAEVHRADRGIGLPTPAKDPQTAWERARHGDAETRARYVEQHFPSDIAVFLDSAADAGFESDDVYLTHPGSLAGPTPVESIAIAIRVLASRIERWEPGRWGRFVEHIRHPLRRKRQSPVTDEPRGKQ